MPKFITLPLALPQVTETFEGVASVQFRKKANEFGGDPLFTYDEVTHTLGVPNLEVDLITSPSLVNTLYTLQIGNTDNGHIHIAHITANHLAAIVAAFPGTEGKFTFPITTTTTDGHSHTFNVTYSYGAGFYGVGGLEVSAITSLNNGHTHSVNPISLYRGVSNLTTTTFSINGVVTPTIGTTRWYPPTPITFRQFYFSVGTPPTTTPIVCKLKINGNDENVIATATCNVGDLRSNVVTLGSGIPDIYYVTMDIVSGDSGSDVYGVLAYGVATFI